MSNVPFGVYLDNGNELSNGLSEHEAYQVALEHSNEHNVTVDIYQGSRHIDTVKPGGALVDYDTTKKIRAATPDEALASIRTAKRDGGAGVIEIDGRKCYVET